MRLFKSKRLVKRIVSIAICLVLSIASLGVFVPENSYDVAALSSSELQNKIDSYAAKQKAIQKKIDSLKDDKADAKEKAEELQEQVSVIESKVSLMSDKISALQSEINEKKANITKKENDIKSAKDLLKKRLRAIYIAGASTDILVLLSADDFGDFLEKTDVMKCITTDTKELMTKLQKEIRVINKEKKAVESKKSEADALKQQLVTEQNNLDAKYKESQNAIAKMQETQNNLEQESAEIQAAKEKAEKEFDALARQAAQAAKNNSSSGGSVPSVKIDGGKYGFAWPYSGSYYISSGFGWRWGKLHGGLDITGGGAYGKPIYAMADGRVILASYYYTYGNCVMIDHGTYNGTSITSLYGHCSSLVVGNGQSVKKGQVIAYVGSTGHSTGPHLHFEIRANGNRVNPLSYYNNY